LAEGEGVCAGPAGAGIGSGEGGGWRDRDAAGCPRLLCIDGSEPPALHWGEDGSAAALSAEAEACVVSAVPYGHWHTSTCIAGLCQDRLVVPFVCDGAINGALFVAYGEQMVVPNLTEAAGANLYLLPAYSPDLNPIEQASAKVKALPRACAARTVDALWRALGSVLGCFTSAECKNCFRTVG
jgi:hypothetical protein